MSPNGKQVDSPDCGLGASWLKECGIIEWMERLLTPLRSLQSAVEFLTGKMDR